MPLPHGSKRQEEAARGNEGTRIVTRSTATALAPRVGDRDHPERQPRTPARPTAPGIGNGPASVASPRKHGRSTQKFRCTSKGDGSVRPSRPHRTRHRRPRPTRALAGARGARVLAHGGCCDGGRVARDRRAPPRGARLGGPRHQDREGTEGDLPMVPLPMAARSHVVPRAHDVDGYLAVHDIDGERSGARSALRCAAIK